MSETRNESACSWCGVPLAGRGSRTTLCLACELHLAAAVERARRERAAVPPPAEPPPPRRCRVCGRGISRGVWERSRLELCSWDCFVAARAAASAAGPEERECIACGRAFTPAREDARFCTNACRQRAYRLRSRGVVLRERPRRIVRSRDSWLAVDLRDHLRRRRGPEVGERIRAWLGDAPEEGVVLTVSRGSFVARFEDEEAVREVAFCSAAELVSGGR